eukprot:4031103-Prymnesium_polylepis.1
MSGASGSGLDRHSPAALEAHGHHLVNRGGREARYPMGWRAGRYTTCHDVEQHTRTESRVTMLHPGVPR